MRPKIVVGITISILVTAAGFYLSVTSNTPLDLFTGVMVTWIGTGMIIDVLKYSRRQ